MSIIGYFISFIYRHYLTIRTKHYCKTANVYVRVIIRFLQATKHRKHWFPQKINLKLSAALVFEAGNANFNPCLSGNNTYFIFHFSGMQWLYGLGVCWIYFDIFFSSFNIKATLADHHAKYIIYLFCLQNFESSNTLDYII